MAGVRRLENKDILFYIFVFLFISCILFLIFYNLLYADEEPPYFYTRPPAPIIYNPPNGSKNAPWKKSEWASDDFWTFKWEVWQFDVQDNESVVAKVYVSDSPIPEGPIDESKKICEREICSPSEVSCKPAGGALKKTYECDPLKNFIPSKLYYWTVRICTKKPGDDIEVCSKNGHDVADYSITNYTFITKSYLTITKEDATEWIRFYPRHYINPPFGIEDTEKLMPPLFNESKK